VSARRLLPLLAAGALLAGCVADDTATTIDGYPACAAPAGQVSRGMLIMAQSVPAARWLPCVRSLPVGWSFDRLAPRQGESVFWLHSDRDGQRALGVLLQSTCDTAGSTEVPSEQPAMRRYERVLRVSKGYGGERYYVFEGGCVTYRFNLAGSTRAEPVAAVSDALGFITRASLTTRLREVSDGRLDLDPA
jgi:hypothetical protein